MKKTILSLLIALSMLASALILWRPVSVTACGGKEPETLLSLYRNSEGIYVGRYLGSEEGEVTRDDEQFTVVEIKKFFDISSTLKGQALKTFTAIDSDHRYKGENAGFETLEEVQKAQTVLQTSISETEVEEENSVELKPGDNVLLFLRHDEESKRLVLTDYADGVKILPLSDIAVYEARIKDLNSIFAAEKPDVEKIVDWLVRCAEGAATRWEGTYELEQSFEALKYKTQQDAERKAKAANGVEGDVEDYYSDDSLETGRTTVFARLLNGYQKQTLSNILLNSEFQAAPQQPGQIGSIAGDSELIKLISRWADDRIAAFFINRLRGGTYTPSENSELMSSIASILDDKQLTVLAEKYSETDYRSDDVEVDEDDLDEPDETTADNESAFEFQPGETAAATADLPKSEATEQKAVESDKTETVKKPVVTYKQLRDKLVSKFLLRADKVMANHITAVEEEQEKGNG